MQRGFDVSAHLLLLQMVLEVVLLAEAGGGASVGLRLGLAEAGGAGARGRMRIGAGG